LRAALWMLVMHGRHLVRLRSRYDPDYLVSEWRCTKAAPCMYKKYGGNWVRRYNWRNFYTDEWRLGVRDCVMRWTNNDVYPGSDLSLFESWSPRKPLSIISDGPVRLRCFTSEDSNWSNNAMMIDRNAIFVNHSSWSGLSIGRVAGNSWTSNGDFELNMLDTDWGRARWPICLSYEGLFDHIEIDG